MAGQVSHLLGRIEGFRHVSPSTCLPPSPSFAWRNCIEPLGPNYLPAESIKKIETDHRSRTAWYAADKSAVSTYLHFASRYTHILGSVPPLHDEAEAMIFAENLLHHTSPRWLMGYRDVTASTDERTVIGGVFPPSAVGHNLPVWTVSAESAEVFPSLLSSFVCDFATRLKVGGKHLSFFIAKQIPALPPTIFGKPAPWIDSGETIHDWLLTRALELTYVSWELEPFAKDCGRDSPPFRWDENRRFLLRCELDAAFFHLYLPTDERGNWCPARRSEGCPCDETFAELVELERHFPKPRDAVAYIMDTFPIVRRKDEKEFGEFRTKRVILEMYDAILEAVSIGESYRTRLDPPPADPRCCHPPRTVRRRVALVELTDLPDGAWARPTTDRVGEELAVLAAVLKAASGPAPIRRIRLAALLAMEPTLIMPSLPETEAAHWRRLIGSQADPLPLDVTPLQPPAHAWGNAVRQLRGTGGLIEDLNTRTWAPGQGLDDIHTEGWPDGRVGVVLNTLLRRGDDVIVQMLPALIRDWVDEEAA